MDKRINFLFVLIITIVVCVGIVIGVVCGTLLFDLQFSKESGAESTPSSSDTEDSDTTDSGQTTSSGTKPEDPMPKKKIALTFDDGPHVKNTQEVLDLLEQYGAKATFFVCGNRLNEITGPVLRRAISLGCEIGNHTYTHAYMTDLSEQELLKEILDTNRKITELSGTDYQCRFYRPPGGKINRKSMETLYENEIYMYSIFWSSDSRDWDYQSQYKNGKITRKTAIEKAFNTIVDETSEGTVILMHDIHEITPDLLKLVLEKYTSEGYAFVTVSELFGFEEDVGDKESYFMRYRSPGSILPQK